MGRGLSRAIRGAVVRALAVALSVAVTISVSSCSATTDSQTLPQGPAIPVGITVDEPGVSLEHDGVYSGFDVTVARYVAGVLGYGQSQIVFVPVTVGNASRELESGTVDMVFSALPADSETRSGWEYVGPYLSASQGLMVRVRDKKTITDSSSLGGRQVCVVEGSGAADVIRQKSPGAVISTRSSYKKCLTALMVGQADAVAGDGAVLSGLVRSEGAGLVTMSSWTYGSSPHAVVIRGSSTELARTIRTALVRMIRDGSWAKAYATLRKDTGYRTGSSLDKDHIEIYRSSVSS